VTGNDDLLALGYAVEQQSSAEALLGMPMPGDGTITFAMQSGGAMVNASMTDNTTNDPNMQVARPLK
jgi:hypothetical protein